MLKLLKNIELYAPNYLGKKDVLIANESIVAIENNLDAFAGHAQVFDFSNHLATPGFIDQHIHITGAGGKDGFSSMTPEIYLSELVACGTTTVVGLLGTDGTVRSIRALYAKAKALEQEGLSAYMFTGYYGLDSVTITESLQSDMIFIDKVLGCKIAISDIRSSYPTALELARKLRDIRVAGGIANKKGILHVHLGNLDSKMDVLFELVQDFGFPIQSISPTHVGRTKPLFEQALEFAKLGGIIDITTGASKYTEPHLSVLYALEQGVAIDNMTFSSDGHAGLTKTNEQGQVIGVKKAPFDQNLAEVVQLMRSNKISIENALKLVTTNPARNLGLPKKGKLALGCDADLCLFSKDFELLDVFARGQHMMHQKEILVKGNFE
jgi:beta-aspartyl-dipeptidase (metallo-type)